MDRFTHVSDARCSEAQALGSSCVFEEVVWSLWAAFCREGPASPLR